MNGRLCSFFPVRILCEPQRSQCPHGSWSCCSPDPGNTPASADVCAVLWACAFVWTPIPCHPWVFSCCSETDPCPLSLVAAMSAAKLPTWKVFSGPISHFWATMGHPAQSKVFVWLCFGCLKNSNLDFGWFHKPLRCEYTQRGCGVLSGLDEPSRLLSPYLQMSWYCALCFGSLWAMMGCLSCCENRKKAQEGFDHTNTEQNSFSLPSELLELMKMRWQSIYTSSWPHMVVPPAILCSRVQHSSLLIYLHLEQKQGRQRKAARTPTHHMLFLMIENGGCAQRSPNIFRGPGACGTTAVVLLFPPVLSPSPPNSAARKLRMLLPWYAFGRHLLCEDAIAATYSPPSYTAQYQCQVPGNMVTVGELHFFFPQTSGIQYFCSHPCGRIGRISQIWGWSQCAAAFARGYPAGAWEQQWEESVQRCHCTVSSCFYKTSGIQSIALLTSHSSRQLKCTLFEAQETRGSIYSDSRNLLVFQTHQEKHW